MLLTKIYLYRSWKIILNLSSTDKIQQTNALPFYRSKMILDRSNCFGWVQIILFDPNHFWSGPTHFGQVQIRSIVTDFKNLDLSKMIWTGPKQTGPVQKDWYSTKMIWTVQNNFATHRRTRHKMLVTCQRFCDFFFI